MAVTMQQIADALGVSKPAVSYALNRVPGQISEDTRQRILETASKMGYRPNTAARATRSGKFSAVGFLFRDDGSTVGSSMVYGVNHQLHQHDLRLMLAPLHNGPDGIQADTPGILREMSVDGLLISLMQDVKPEFYDLVEQSATPAIWLNANLPDNCIRADDIGMIHQMTRELIGLGHQRIAFVGYDLSDAHHYSGEHRLAGYRHAMGEAGHPCYTVELGHPSHPPNGQTLLQNILTGSDRPTALVCASDDLATSILYNAACAGLRVPEQLSVATVMNHHNCSLGVQLGGVLVPFRQMGETAVNMLLQRTIDGTSKTTQVISGTYKPGNTVAGPGQS